MIRSESIPSSEFDIITETADGTSASRPVVQAASLPQTAGGDPLPPTSNGSSVLSEIAPPPAIQGMAPLSATAMSSFASAANGVTTDSSNGGPQSGDGKVVLNGVSGST
jgi:poly(A) polymerase